MLNKVVSLSRLHYHFFQYRCAPSFAYCDGLAEVAVRAVSIVNTIYMRSTESSDGIM